MLSFKLHGNILEVIETLPSWRATKVTYWYYDINTWRVSSTGKQGSPIDRDMTQSAIDWVIKHYFPKVGLTSELTAV